MPRSDSAAPSAKPPPLTAASESELSNVLATPLLDLLDLPPRVAAFAYAEGLETIGDLARIAPDALLAERNLGRKSVGITRRILEERIGVSWEEIACPKVANETTEPEHDPDPHGWDAVRRRLRDEQRRIPVAELDLPDGLGRLLETRGIVTLGDLAQWSRAELLEVPGIGRRTLVKLPIRVTARLDVLAAEYVEADRSLFWAFLRAADQLEAKRCFIVRARAGLDGRAMSLAEIALVLRVSQERIRQLEERAAVVLRGRAWAKHAERRVEEALVDGPVPFAAFSTDPWWALACERPALVGFVVERVLDDLARVFQFDGDWWLSPHARTDVEDTWSVLVHAAERLVRPAPEHRVDELLSHAVERLGPCRHVMDRFRDKILR